MGHPGWCAWAGTLTGKRAKARTARRPRHSRLRQGCRDQRARRSPPFDVRLAAVLYIRTSSWAHLSTRWIGCQYGLIETSNAGWNRVVVFVNFKKPPCEAFKLRL